MADTVIDESVRSRMLAEEKDVLFQTETSLKKLKKQLLPLLKLRNKTSYLSRAWKSGRMAPVLREIARIRGEIKEEETCRVETETIIKELEG